MLPQGRWEKGVADLVWKGSQEWRGKVNPNIFTVTHDRLRICTQT